MRIFIALIALLIISSTAFAGQIVDSCASIRMLSYTAKVPDMTYEKLKRSSYIDEENIVKYNKYMTKEKILELFKYIDPDKIKWAKEYMHDKEVEMVEPAHIIFYFETVSREQDPESRKSLPPVYYVLKGIKILGLSPIPQEVHKKGDWELRVFLRNMGTKSEGTHGVLYYKGEELPAGKAGEEKNTDLGIMKYYGEVGKLKWAPTGWNFKDGVKCP